MRNANNQVMLIIINIKNESGLMNIIKLTVLMNDEHSVSMMNYDRHLAFKEFRKLFSRFSIDFFKLIHLNMTLMMIKVFNVSNEEGEGEE